MRGFCFWEACCPFTLEARLTMALAQVKSLGALRNLPTRHSGLTLTPFCSSFVPSNKMEDRYGNRRRPTKTLSLSAGRVADPMFSAVLPKAVSRNVHSRQRRPFLLLARMRGRRKQGGPHARRDAEAS